MENINFSKALQQFNSGKYQKTIELLEKIKNKKRDGSAWSLLAMSYASIGKLNKAELCFIKSITLNPNDYVSWSNLGLSQLRQGKNKKAITSFKRSLEINSTFTDALCNSALAHYYLGQYELAIKYAKQSIIVNPKAVSAYNIIGLCLKETDLKNAISYFVKAIDLNAHYYDAYHNIIDTYFSNNELEKAESWALKCVSMFNNIDSLIILGKIFEKQNKLSEALDTYNNCIRLQKDHAAAISGIAGINVSQGNTERALSLLEDALKSDTDNPALLSEISNIYILKKQYADAYTLLNKHLNNNQTSLSDPSLLLPFSIACRNTGHIDEAIKRLTGFNTLPNKKASANEAIKYALASLYDKKGLYDKAFNLYSDANTATNCSSDIEYYLSLFKKINKTFPVDTTQLGTTNNTTAPSPVFIVGMPRSGTSLIERIIASHPQVHGAGEINNLWSIANKISNDTNLTNFCSNVRKLNNSNIDLFAREYRNHTKMLCSKNERRCTDKLPHNFFLIGLIDKLFPDAHIIHCSRHPFDVCLSIYFNNFNTNHCYARNLNDLALFYQQYEKLMSHWENFSSSKILNIKYENLINEPEKHTRELIQFIELDWDETCLKYHESNQPIMTPSFDQANQPIYKGSINRWENYKNHIKPLEKIFGNPKNY